MSQRPRITLQLVAGYLRHYQQLQSLSDWAFTVELVRNLKHDGQDAWAVVLPDISDPDRPKAHVQVRDIDATPIPGFDGDPLLEIRVTISHELWHCWTRRFADHPTVDIDEAFVEAAAQAVVRSEGGVDARVMARASNALPSAIRARVANISARARRRARGGQMDPETIKALIECIKTQDGAAALAICEKALADQAGAATGAPHAEPAGDAVAPPTAAKVEADPGAAAPGEAPPAARAKEADDMPKEDARRARAARAEIEAMAASMRPNALAALVSATRARVALSPAAEKEILSAATFAEAQRLAAFAEKMGPAVQRARSGAGADAAPPPAGAAAPFTAAQLQAEGIPAALASEIVEQHKASPALAANSLQHARARLGATSNPWMPKPAATGAQKVS